MLETMPLDDKKTLKQLNKEVEKLEKNISELEVDDYSKKFFADKIKSLQTSMDILKRRIIKIIEKYLQNIKPNELNELEFVKNVEEDITQNFANQLSKLKEEYQTKKANFYESEKYQNYHLNQSVVLTLNKIVCYEKYSRLPDESLNVVDLSIFLIEEKALRNQYMKELKVEDLKQEIEKMVKFYDLYRANSDEFDKRRFFQFLKSQTPKFYHLAKTTLQSDLEQIIVKAIKQYKLPKYFSKILQNIKQDGLFSNLKDMRFVLEENEKLLEKEANMDKEFQAKKVAIQKQKEEALESLKNPQILKEKILDYLFRKMNVSKKLTMGTVEEEQLLLEFLRQSKNDKNLLNKLENYFQNRLELLLQKSSLEQSDNSFKKWKENFENMVSFSGREAELEIYRLNQLDTLETLTEELNDLNSQKEKQEEQFKITANPFLLWFYKKNKKKIQSLNTRKNNIENDLTMSREEKFLKMKEVNEALKKLEESFFFTKKQKSFFREFCKQQYALEKQICTKEQELDKKNRNYSKFSKNYDNTSNLPTILAPLIEINKILTSIEMPSKMIDYSYKSLFQKLPDEFAKVLLPKSSVLEKWGTMISERYSNWRNDTAEEITSLKSYTDHQKTPFAELLLKSYHCEDIYDINSYNQILQILKLLEKFQKVLQRKEWSQITLKELAILQNSYQKETHLIAEYPLAILVESPFADFNRTKKL